LLKRSGRVVCLIKPQFEVGAGNLGKSGIVGDSELRNLARENVHACASASGLQVLATMESPITGGDGNIEFLTLLKHAESI
jgi:23S rRNA (cytidine1920-2'-O)/16S rRNA (cytidine1409-2'-O)-methyltransferase